MRKIITFIFIFLSMTTTYSISKELNTYPASASFCNRSCDFDHAKMRGCATRKGVTDYVRKEVLPVLLEGTRKIANKNQMACVCVTANLNPSGYFTNIKIIKSSNINTSEMIENYLKSVEFSAVPDTAACLLEKQNNPFPMSFYN